MVEVMAAAYIDPYPEGGYEYGVDEEEALKEEEVVVMLVEELLSGVKLAVVEDDVDSEVWGEA